MLNRVLKNIAVLTAFISLADVLFGQGPVNSDPLFSLGPRVIISKPKDADSSTFYGGAQVRFGLIPNIKFEGSIDHRRNDFNKYTQADVYPFQASVMACLTPNLMVSPFLLGGAGLYYTRIETPFGFNYSSKRFGVHVGAGLEIRLNSRLSLDGSYRLTWVEKFNSQDISTNNKDYEDSGHLVTIGLNVLFF